jgi:hypothetical protein
MLIGWFLHAAHNVLSICLYLAIRNLGSSIATSQGSLAASLDGRGIMMGL